MPISNRILVLAVFLALITGLAFWLRPEVSSPAARGTSKNSSPVASSAGVSSPAPDSERETPFKLSMAPTEVKWPVPARKEVEKRGPVDSTRVQGEMVSIRAEVGSKTIELLPNAEGQFPPLYVGPQTKTPVTAYFPESSPGDHIFLQMLDGGKINDRLYAKEAVLDQQRLLTFDFTTSSNPGRFRVLMRKGGEIKTVDFWVGPDIPIRQQTAQR
jgi:hypothetical protein